MESKIYTAQELSETANNLDSVYVAPECEDKKEQYKHLSLASIMLRQAAEMRERLDELLLTFHSCPDERDLLNYILYGNTGKDGK